MVPHSHCVLIAIETGTMQSASAYRVIILRVKEKQEPREHAKMK